MKDAQDTQTSQPTIILCAQRDDTYIEETVSQLQNTDHTIIWAQNKHELQQILAAGNVDLIIIDTDVVDVTAQELGRDIRNTPDVGLILVSARGEPDDLVHSLESGADDYLTRPFEPAELLARVDAVLRRRNATLTAQQRSVPLAVTTCPYLGLLDAPHSAYAAPTQSHRCYAAGHPELVDVEHQNAFCMSDAFSDCARYVSPLEDDVPTNGIVTEQGAWLRRPVVWLLAMFALVVSGGYIYFNLLTHDSPASTVAAAIIATETTTSQPTETERRIAVAQVDTPTATSTSLPTTTPTVSQSTPMPAATSVPGLRTVTLNPAPNAVGWVSEQERINRFGDRNLHAGIFNGDIYYGAFQFRLDTIPAGTTIDEATIELTGLSVEALGDTGTWTLQMLGPELDEAWTRVTYDQLRNATVINSVGSALEPDDLGDGRTNTFTFTSDQLRALERRLESGLISFRIVGPESGDDNLFTWDSGVSSTTRPALKVVYNLPPTPTPAIVIPTETPENIVTAAAVAARATYEATVVGTPTPLPVNYITATPRVIIVNTATPQTTATAQVMAAEATARAYLFGTPTPFPAGAWTATPIPPTPTPTGTSTPTPMPLIIPLTQIPTPTGAASPSPTPASIPAELRGKIVFLSDRFGSPQTFVMDTDGSNISWLTDSWAYYRALDRETFSPDGSQRTYVQSRPEPGRGTFYEIWVQNTADGFTYYLTGGSRITYSPVWKPTGNTIAFVAQDAGNDEIYLIDVESLRETRLTDNQWEWDKHPSWSPDGSQIVFWSNRGGTGKQEIWVMSADGTNQRPLVQDEWNNWDPVWIK